MSGYNSSAPRAIQTKNATVSNTAKAVSHADFAFSAAELAAAAAAIITSRSAGVMLTWSGVAPTTTIGHFLPQDGTLEVRGNLNVQALQFIRDAGVDASVTITLES